jgi:hypothetical protein
MERLYPLLQIALGWLCFLLHVLWPNARTTAPPTRARNASQHPCAYGYMVPLPHP